MAAARKSPRKSPSKAKKGAPTTTGEASGSGRSTQVRGDRSPRPPPPSFLFSPPTPQARRTDDQRARTSRGTSRDAPSSSRTTDWLGATRARDAERTRDLEETFQDWRQAPARRSSDREALDIDDPASVRQRGQKRPYAEYGDEDSVAEGSEWLGLGGEEDQAADEEDEEEYLQSRKCPISCQLSPLTAPPVVMKACKKDPNFRKKLMKMASEPVRALRLDHSWI